jgi:hypothetical protein
MESVIPQILLIIGCYCTSVFAFIYYLENNSYFADADADSDSDPSHPVTRARLTSFL